MKLTASFWPYVLTSAAQFERAKPHFLHEFQKKNHRSLWRWNRPRNHKSHLGSLLSKIDGGALKLSLITNRGVKVYPDGMKETFCTDHWRCRFIVGEGNFPLFLFCTFTTQSSGTSSDNHSKTRFNHHLLLASEWRFRGSTLVEVCQIPSRSRLGSGYFYA